MINSTFTKEDLTTKEAIGAVIYDAEWRVLMQDHVKLDFFTIPIWKVREWENPDEVIRNELFDEIGIKIIKFEKIAIQDWVYDYNWIKVKIRNHIYKILSRSWAIENKEPAKHRLVKFMTIDEIKKLPKISDATRIFLSTLT